MEDAPNRILTAALDYIFSLHWSCDSDTQGHEKSQLSSTPATTCAPHSGAQRMWFYPAQHLVHETLSRVLLTIEWGSTCGISTPQGSWRRLVPEWAKEPVLPLLRTQLCPSKCAVTRHCPKHRLGQSSAGTSIGRLTGKVWCLQKKHKKISWRTEGRINPGLTRSSETRPFGEQGVYLCQAPW